MIESSAHNFIMDNIMPAQLSAQPSKDDIDRLLVSVMSEDALFDFVDPQTMREGDPDASRAYWRLSEDGSSSQTVIHTNHDASIVYIKRYLQHCNPRPTTATPLSHDDAHAEWLKISAGTPTYQGSSHFVVE
jgi:hypothetical protein